MASLSPSLSAVRQSGLYSKSYRGKVVDSCREAQTFRQIRAFENLSTHEWPQLRRLISSRSDQNDTFSKRTPCAVLGQRDSGASQEPGNNESQAELQQSGSSTPAEASITVPLVVTGQEASLPDNLERSDLTGRKEGVSEGFVFGCGNPDAWDCGRVGSPIVRRYVSDNDERWCMWYAGENRGDTSGTCVGLATSSNGMHWRRGKAMVDTQGQDEDGAVGLVLDRSTNWWAFDTQHLYPSDVLIMSSAKVRAASGVYWLYYSGADADEFELPPIAVATTLNGSAGTLRGRTRPGLAISNDGRNWARIEGDHHSGALFDIGAEGEWDSLFIAAPQVVFNEPGDIRMYYHSLDPSTGKYSVGFARSRDGMRWLKFGKILEGGKQGAFDELGISARQVLEEPNGNGYLMVYEGIAADGRSSIGLARSDAGLLNWERCQDEPIFGPAESEWAWDGVSVGSPCLVHMDGEEWRLYYVGVGSTRETAIGMAMNVEGSLTRFTRWHGFHL